MEPRIAKCLLLSKVLSADGMMTENENAFLERSMTRMGLQGDERRSVLALEGWNDAETALAGLSEVEKHELVGQLSEAASADGRKSPLESAMLERITKALGV